MKTPKHTDVQHGGTCGTVEDPHILEDYSPAPDGSPRVRCGACGWIECVDRFELGWGASVDIYAQPVRPYRPN